MWPNATQTTSTLFSTTTKIDLATPVFELLRTFTAIQKQEQ